MLTDIQLLSRYAHDRSEAAFGDLVSRRVGLVYFTALRLVNGDEALARDVAQSVFTDLATKSAELYRQRSGKLGGEASTNLSLAGWLYTSTRFAACKAVRAEQTRRKHEEEAQAMTELLRAGSPEPDWTELRPVLEEAMSNLAEPERDAVLLRFLEGKDLRTVGAMLGMSEEAARKRVSRSLDKLRAILATRGVTTTAAALSVTLTTQALAAVPAGLAATLTSASLAAAAATTTTSHSTLGLIKLMASMKMKLGLAAVLVAAVATPLVIQRQANLELRAENGQLQRALEKLRVQLTNQPVAVAAPTNREEHSELLRLRGQVGRLRHELSVRAALTKPEKAVEGLSPTQRANLAEPEEWREGKFLPKAKISNRGLATPEAAAQTYLWSMLQEDATVAKNVLSDNPKLNIGILREEFADRLDAATGVNFDGYSSNAASFTALLSVHNSDNSELSKRVQLSFQDGSWRVVDDQWTPLKALFGPTVTQQEAK